MNSKKEVQHVYLVGAKSLGAYGGYETFVYKLTEYLRQRLYELRQQPGAGAGDDEVYQPTMVRRFLKKFPKRGHKSDALARSIMQNSKKEA